MGGQAFWITASRAGCGDAQHVHQAGWKTGRRGLGDWYKSVAVPGTVAGLELAVENLREMKLAEVMKPAIRLAENGFAVSEKLADELRREKTELGVFPVSRRIFLNDGRC